MSNPYLMRVPFCNSGANKNTIQVSRQPTQPPQDATYEEGFPTVTMVPTGGIAPNGQDMNGILNEISSAIVHYCRGDRIQFDAVYAAAIGGYDKGVVLASNDYSKDYISLVDNNTANPNGSNTTWAVYAGQGSIPVATSTTEGITKVLNVLNSTDIASALSANMGRILKNDLDLKLNTSQALGVGQTWQDVTASRSSGVTYTNNTGKPIMISVIATGRDATVTIYIGSVLVAKQTDIFDSGGNSSTGSTIVPAGATYMVISTNKYGVNVTSWAELR